ncbi:MAG: hypothetical protein H6969_01190 [Gammaproteobacteria bacterium]|nr:hypothetical protein [Gammaproteobacteria bacterium]
MAEPHLGSIGQKGGSGRMRHGRTRRHRFLQERPRHAPDLEEKGLRRYYAHGFDTPQRVVVHCRAQSHESGGRSCTAVNCPASTRR